MLFFNLGTIHSKKELRTMLELHVQHGAVDAESGKVMDGALKFRDMTVSEIMTPSDQVFMLSINDNLNFKVLSDIFKKGYSRIPVYNQSRNDIVGIILSKDLLFIDARNETPIKNFIALFGYKPPVVWPDQKLGEVLAHNFILFLFLKPS